ncbi:MAG TPA: choice-of-anchor Q domain-containing protein [Fibrobacteria bacterium]|nr:choice-of-anchor Q domain-containing protein [Fibrobacteria bacterium]
MKRGAGFTTHARMATLALAGLVCSVRADYVVKASAAGLTTVAQDGKCNLTEAIISMHQGPVNSDCVPQGQTRTILLQGANTAFQMATDLTIGTNMGISTSDAGVVIEETGTPLGVSSDGVLTLTGPSGGLTVRVKSGLPDKALVNSGTVTGTNVIFQGGTYALRLGGVIQNHGELRLTGGAIQGGTAPFGGGLYTESSRAVILQNVKIQNNTATQSGGGIYNNSGTYSDHLILQRCVIQNNTAALRGGGVYNNGQTDIHYSAVKGNVAGQGGGVYHQKGYSPTPQTYYQPEFTASHTTFSGNKAVATELTSGGTASTNASACSSGEGAGQAFDDTFATKWCGGGIVPSVAQPVDITYNFGAGASKVVSSYSITSANDVSGRDPMDWKFQGYSNGSWRTLQTITGFRFTARRQGFNFGPDGGLAFQNTTACSAYRLLITKNAGDPGATQLSEFQLYPVGQSGDGGGIYTIGHSVNNNNNTLSGNLAGCTTPSCACTAAFCASASGTSAVMGRGGALFAISSEAIFQFQTVAGNSASQGGGVYTEWGDDWAWRWSLIGKNTARTNYSPEPDFHGSMHSSGVFGWHENFVQNPAGTTDIFEDADDVANQDPLLNALADNGGAYPELHPLTHSLQAGSPAKDRAVSAYGMSGDQRGVARPQGAFSDMGAYELK